MHFKSKLNYISYLLWNQILCQSTTSFLKENTQAPPTLFSPMLKQNMYQKHIDLHSSPKARPRILMEPIRPSSLPLKKHPNLLFHLMLLLECQQPVLMRKIILETLQISYHLLISSPESKRSILHLLFP